MRKICLFSLVCVGILLGCISSSRASSYSFTPFDVPGTSSPIIGSINDAGQVIGYFDAGDRDLGFVWRSGTVILLDVPAAVGGGQGIFGPGTYPHDVSDAGQVVGEFYGKDGRRRDKRKAGYASSR
jgi:hypothetical protein